MRFLLVHSVAHVIYQSYVLNDISRNEFQFTDVLQIILILVRLDLDLCSNVVHLPIQRTICALIGGIKLGSNNDSDLVCIILLPSLSLMYYFVYLFPYRHANEND